MPLESGMQLGPYKIGRPLGAGGMGEVYQAHDTRLGRDVALKLLPSEAAQDATLRQRLEQEARVVASVHHPNIVTLFSVEEEEGQLFLTMELVRGPQLSELLTSEGFDMPRLLELALPLTEAVGAAHDAGLVHRDLKPANILLDDKGRLKILDFGLAKQLKPSNLLEDATIQMSLTEGGTIVGTCAYMSPEQAQSGDIDPRSDVFSLGIILYEMACGQRPFVGDNPISIISSIIKDAPAPLREYNASLPPALAEIIMRCLAKDPEQRWKDGGELHAALASLKRDIDTGKSGPVRGAGRPVSNTARRLAIALPLVVVMGILAWRLVPRGESFSEVPGSGAGSATQNVVVVFPFENLGQAGDDYFADGVTDEIASQLTSIEGIGVISRTSAMRYDRTGKSLAQIAQDLNVDFVLEGTIRWDRSGSGDSRLRITPQLVRVQDQVSVWSESYERDLRDVFVLQSEIARQVVSSIDASLVPAGRRPPAGPRTDNLEAYDLYLQAKQYMRWGLGPSQTGLLRAAALLEQALALDPDFAAAHAGLSRVSSAMYFRGFDRSAARLALADRAADRALQLDESLAEAHLAKGLFLYRSVRDYRQALEQLQIARKLAPGEAEILSWIGTLRKRQGQFEKSAEILQQAQRMDPYNPTIPGELSIVYRTMGNFAAALEAIDRVIDLDPSFNARRLRVNLLESWTGDLQPRRRLLEESAVGRRWDWATLYARERQFDKALAELDSIQVDADRSNLSIVRLALFKAELHWVQGDTATAREIILEVLPVIEGESQVDEGRHDFRGLAYAVLGREEEALRDAELALQATNVTLDALTHSDVMYRVAAIHAVLGNIPETVRWLEKARDIDKSFTVHTLRLDYQWDPIREHPEFQAFMRRIDVDA